MTAPEPASTLNNLLDQLDLLFKEEAPADGALLGQIEWQARKCARAHPHGAQIVFGLVAALREDEGAAENAFQKARAHGWTPAWALNYASMLRWFYRFEGALFQAKTVIDQGPASAVYADALEKAIDWAHVLGRFHLASDLLAALRRHSRGPLSALSASVAEKLPPILAAADELGLTDDQMAAIQAPALDLLREEKIRGQILLNDHSYNDGDLFIGRAFLLPVPSEAILPLYEKLVAAEAAQEPQEPPLPVWKFGVTLASSEDV